MRFSMALLVTALIGSTCWAEPIAVFTPDLATGLGVLTSPDGQWEYKAVQSKKAAVLKPDTTPASRYMYFKLDPDKRKICNNGDVWIEVEFMDSDVGSVRVEYNGD